MVVIPFPAPSLRSLENGKWGRSSKVLIMAFFFSFKFCSLEHKQGEQQAEGEAGSPRSREPNVGLHRRTWGSRRPSYIIFLCVLPGFLQADIKKCKYICLFTALSLCQRLHIIHISCLTIYLEHCCPAVHRGKPPVPT